MTAQGKRWWGDDSATNIEAFGKINKSKIGKVFTEKDRYILQTLFYPFSERFGYVKKDIKKFKSDLKIIYPLMQEMFDFEKELPLVLSSIASKSCPRKSLVSNNCCWPKNASRN